MINKKELLRENLRLSEENVALRKVQREYEDLESFIVWLNEFCHRKKYQFCGLRKITFKHSQRRSCYIGFLLENKLCLEPQKHYEYTIYGYLSTAKKCDLPDAAYTAILKQSYSEALVGISNTMELTDNFVRPDDIKHEGIGSAGMSIIKELAKHLHCTLIDGEKRPKKNTPEELAILTAFYGAHGFEQDDHSRHISFDMKNYQQPEFEISEDI